MSVRIRLQRKGRKKAPFYHIVVADQRSPRDGRFIEKLGYYNPMTKPATIELDRDSAFTWLMNGAQPSNTARAILSFKGLYYRKHLQRGVAKGALTQEKADEMYNEWVEAKEAKIAKRVQATADERTAYLKKISGVAPPKEEVVEEVAEEAVVEVKEETLAEAAVDTIDSIEDAKKEASAEAKVEEAATEVKEEVEAKVEEKVEEVKEEAPAEEEKTDEK